MAHFFTQASSCKTIIHLIEPLFKLTCKGGVRIAHSYGERGKVAINVKNFVALNNAI